MKNVIVDYATVKSLTAEELQMFILIGLYKDPSKNGVMVLAEELNLSERQTQRILSNLIRKNFIVQAGSKMSNAYFHTEVRAHRSTTDAYAPTFAMTAKSGK